MRSIRLSLLLYFLALLAVALGAVSVLAYQNSHRLLQAKEASQAALLQADYKNSCDREREKVNLALLHQAQILARQVQMQFHWQRMSYQQYLPLGALTLAPAACLVAPVSISFHPWGPLHEHYINNFITDMKISQDFLPGDQESHFTEYWQINEEKGRNWRSRSLGPRSLSFGSALFQKLPLHEWQADEVELEPGQLVSRVTLKAPITSIRTFVGPQRARPPGPRGNRPGSRSPPRDYWENNSPAILIQFATETTQRDAKLASLAAEYTNELDKLRAESEATLGGLRYRLGLISLATFALTIVGGIWLVRAGLLPLQRLSKAVSLVSPKDFRLPFDETRLPGELRPIVNGLSNTLALLKRAFAREKQAAADISHELRTPLAAMLTTVDVGLRKPRSPEEYRELLSDCRASGQQMNQLVERLLALARLDAGVDTLRPRLVDILSLAKECTTLVRPLAEARGLTVRLDRDEPISLQTDPDKFREVLNNLLHNAIEYNRPQGKVEMSLQQENGHVCVEVRDTGIGIAPDAREHIFERFYRADPSRSSDGLHAGLGLAIVKGYVDLMGGTIKVESVVGQGSIFRLQLPARLSESIRSQRVA